MAGRRLNHGHPAGWLRLLAVDGDLARAEPKTLHYKILHTAARLMHSGRQRRLKSPEPGRGATTVIATVWTHLEHSTAVL
jgi:hypothetical protein